MIDIRATDDPLTFDVTVRDASGATQHRVTLTPAMQARFAVSPERLVDAAFRFLLDREPKESILARFELSLISRYFPEFEQELPRYLAKG